MLGTLYIATVTRVGTSGFIYVRVPRLSGGERGPLEPLYEPWLTEHGEAVGVGTRLVVGVIENDPDRLVILRRF